MVMKGTENRQPDTMQPEREREREELSLIELLDLADNKQQIQRAEEKTVGNTTVKLPGFFNR